MKRIIDNGKLPPTPKAAIEKFNANIFVLENFLFQEQLAFVQDSNPFKVAVCSRRAGKTTACAAHLLHTALNNPDSTNLYITLSSVSGKRIIWKEFKKILKSCAIKDVKLNEIELSLTFKNGATIYVVGAKDASEIEKFRGMAMKLVYIDECQSFKSYIEELIDDIIGPALIDYAGSLVLIGTPGPIPVGYFHKCSTDTSNTWSKHHWTYWQNPFIPITSKMTHQQVFDREMKRRGITNYQDPSVQREWFGKWVLDTNSLLYRYDEAKNHYQKRPDLPGKWHYILGIDIGFDDADALAVLAYHDSSPDTYLVDELVTAKQGLTELVQQVQQLQSKYDITKMVMDMGGLGKKMGEEMIRRYQIPVEAADKARKMETVEFLNDAMRTGRFKAKSASRFAQDTYLVEIDRDKSTPERIKVSDRYHSDICDAVLYAFKFSPAYAYQAPIEKPKPGSPEWLKAQSNEMWEAELKGHLDAQAFKDEYGDY